MTNINLKCNYITQNDIDNVYYLQKKTFHDFYSKCTLKDEINNSNYLYLVCKINGEFAGYISGLKGNPIWDIMRIAVLKQYRAMGIGFMLINTFLEIAKENNAQKAMLEVRKGNTPAIKLYEKSGFDNIFTRKNYYQNPTEDAIIYSKNII